MEKMLGITFQDDGRQIFSTYEALPFELFLMSFCKAKKNKLVELFFNAFTFLFHALSCHH